MNNSLEILKNELIAQKDIIISKGGNVQVHSVNPTPSEITAGLRTINAPDFTISTALPEDVSVGKTFYSGNAELKTGTLSTNWDTIKTTFLYNQQRESEEEYIFTMRSPMVKLRNYLCYTNKNSVTIYFNEDIEDIGEYSFYSCTNFHFPNLSACSNLRIIRVYAFYDCRNSNIDFSNLPASLKTIETRVFSDNIKVGDSLNLPALTSWGQYTFNVTTNPKALGSFTYAAGFSNNCMPNYAISNCQFSNSLVVPACATYVGAYFNYRSTFKTITIPATCTALYEKCFGSYNYDSLAMYANNEWITFEAETPPTFGANCFSLQSLQNGCKIFVPDNAVEAYKAVPNLAQYANYIYPVSERE